MRFRARKTIRLGPLFATFTQRGFSSWGLRIGPFTWNATRRTSTVDTPGPGSVHFGGRSRRWAR